MAGSIRLYTTSTLAEGASVAASAAQAHYLGHVMRRALGAPVLLFNGRDGEFAARVRSIGRDRAILGVERRTRVQAAEADVWLVFAPLKRDATDLVARMATELGVAALHPVLTERSNTHRVNAARLAAIAIEAAEQSERLTLPMLHPPRPLPALLSEWPQERRLFAMIERIDARRVPPTHGGPRALQVGPEGGFTAAELDALRGHPLVTPVSLGPRVLRAETACVAGLALLQAVDCR
jgi:16S rRNA (uracil1498-N3)-methyltransferase